MGKQTCSVDTVENGSDNENADIESEDVSEEDEPSEEDPVEEDQAEDEPQEVNSCEGPEEDPYIPNEDHSYEQELDGVASREEEHKEIDSYEESCEEEPYEEEIRNEESCEEEPYEEDKQREEEMRNEESCEDEPFEEDEPYEEDEQCEEEMVEPCEEPEKDRQCDEEMIEEPCEEPEEDRQYEDEPIEEEPCEELEEPCEEEPDEEAGDEEEPEEDMPEDPEEESYEGSPICQFYNRKEEKSIQSNSKKMRISSDMALELENISKTSGIRNSPSGVTVPAKPVSAASTVKKRQSKRDMKDEANELAEKGDNVGTKKRKSRRSNDDPQTIFVSPLRHPAVEVDLEIPKLHAQLLDVNKKLQSGVINDQPQDKGSPSPPPIYDNLGIQITTREARVCSKLMIQKRAIISELIQKDPNFKPPPDYKTSKLCKKIFVPLKDYPGYNFAGLILGPCGNTQKKLEETGARIKLSGRGSKLDTKMMQGELEPSGNEDLHVLIEADNQYSLDAAVAIVEKLLIPVDDGHNEDKLSQLSELNEIGGNLKENHTSNTKKPDTSNACSDTSHHTSSCPMMAPTTGTNSTGQKVNSVEVGSGLSPFNAQPPLSVSTIPSMNSSTSQGHKVNIAEMARGLSPFDAQPPLSVCTVPSVNNSKSRASRPKKVINDANLFVGCLPQSVDDNALIELFAPFGPLSRVNVIRDRSTNISKGYGFVMYADHISAAKAVAHMNGVEIDGKVLSVRIAGILPPSHIDQLPSYPGTSVIAQNNPRPMCWSRSPESRLPGTVASLSNNCSYPVHHSPFSGQYLGSIGPSFQTPAQNSPFSRNFVPSNELAQFRGYMKSLDSPPLLHHPALPSNNLPSSQTFPNAKVRTKAKKKKSLKSKIDVDKGKKKINIDKGKKKIDIDRGKKKKKLKAKGKCFHCGINGHWKRNCREYLASIKKNISSEGFK